MGIPHLTLDVRDGCRADVVDDFVSEYAAGRTPNPCVRCNGLVRFDAMLALAGALGAARLPTGHFARPGDGGCGAPGPPAPRPAQDPGDLPARRAPGQPGGPGF